MHCLGGEQRGRLTGAFSKCAGIPQQHTIVEQSIEPKIHALREMGVPPMAEEVGIVPKWRVPLLGMDLQHAGNRFRPQLCNGRAGQVAQAGDSEHPGKDPLALENKRNTNVLQKTQVV